MQELIKALRCSTKPKTDFAECRGCRYGTLEPINEKIPAKPDVIIDGDAFWTGCDCDKMANDAADQLEELSKRNEPIMGLRDIALDKCPVCGKVSSIYRPQYCHNCGQALKWERHMKKETLIKLMRTNYVICYDENGVACKLTKEDKELIAESVELTIALPGIEKEGERGEEWYCTRCGSQMTFRHQDYCDECGQKLYWHPGIYCW